MTRARSRRGDRGAVLGAGLALACLAVWGCGGSAAGTAPNSAPADTIQRPPAPIVKDAKDIYNVTLYTNAGQFPVDKLEIEFNRRRGIHEFYGFYRDSYDRMARIPFGELERVDFLGQMPPAIFDQATIGRENENLRLDNAFEVRLTYKDNRQEDFFAIIPKFRGEKDLELWEFSMNSKNNVIQYIEFNR